MDIFSPPQSKKADIKPAWPTARMEDGRWVIVTDHFGDRIAAMTEATWTTIGTVIEQQKRIMAAQDTKVKQLQAANADLADENRRTLERMNNLREVRRNEQRAELEQGLILPGDLRFDPKKATQRK